MVRLEFYEGTLGRITINENNGSYHWRGSGRFDGSLSPSKNEVDVTVLEADPVYVGGISRTATYKGFHFDIGGHRFFSKSKAVENLWAEILPNDMLERPRSSRIFYGGKFFAYPLKAFEALTKLGIGKSILCVLSWLKARLFPVRDPNNFEDWVSNQFGRRLFNIFLQELHREGLGDELQRDFRGLGCPANQRLIVRQRYQECTPAAASAKGQTKVIKTLINSFNIRERSGDDVGGLRGKE